MAGNSVIIAFVDALDPIFAEYDEGIEAVKSHVECKVEEKLDVPLPDTIGEPLTMVIHTEDASVTF